MVNLSARLMQYATVNGGGVVVEEATMKAAADRLFFERLEPITVKGKSMPIKIFMPYPHCMTPVFARNRGNRAAEDHGHGGDAAAIAHDTVVTTASPAASARSLSIALTWDEANALGDQRLNTEISQLPGAGVLGQSLIAVYAQCVLANSFNASNPLARMLRKKADISFSPAQFAPRASIQVCVIAFIVNSSLYFQNTHIFFNIFLHTHDTL